MDCWYLFKTVKMRRSSHVCITLLLWINLLYVCLATTLIAARGKDGLILVSDSLSPSQDSSPLISTALSRNIFLLSDEIAIACVKGAADFHKVYEELSAVQREEVFQRQRGLSLKAIARHARQLVYQKYPSAHILIAGCQSKTCHDASNWKLFEVLPGGSLIEQDFVVAGSGGDVATSLLASLYSKVDSTSSSPDKDHKIEWIQDHEDQQASSVCHSSSCDLTVEDLLPTLQRAMTASIQYDPKSGGRNRTIWLLKNNKWIRLVGQKNKGGKL